MTTRRKFLLFSGAALATPVLPRLASAQQWPARQIRAIVPFSAGSTIDIIGRIVLEPLSAAFGQPIVVENRGGAGGTIGTAFVAKAEPDGYTILIHASAHSAAPAAYPNAPYHAGRDLAGVALFGSVPNVTVISPAKGSGPSRSWSQRPRRARSRSRRRASAARRIGGPSACGWLPGSMQCTCRSRAAPGP